MSTVNQGWKSFFVLRVTVMLESYNGTVQQWEPIIGAMNTV